MRNVIVFATDWGRYAVELRWVREVVTLGHITPVPGAPAHIAGAVNVRGTITPVMDVGVLAGLPAGPGEGHGDGAVLLDVEDLTLALRILKVDEVATVGEGPPLPRHACGGAAAVSVIDSRRERVPLIDPPELVRISLAAAHALAAADPISGFRPVDGRHGRVSGRISTETQGLLGPEPGPKSGQEDDGDEFFQ